MEAFYGTRYPVSAPAAQLTGAPCGITYGDVTQCLWNRAGARMGFFSSRILSEITKGINYSARPGRGGNNISKSLMEMQNRALPPHTNWDDGWLKKCASHCPQPPPFRQPYPTPAHHPGHQHPPLSLQGAVCTAGASQTRICSRICPTAATWPAAGSEGREAARPAQTHGTHVGFPAQSYPVVLCNQLLLYHHH